MKWFGEDWGAPVCDPAYHVATPIGEQCDRCRGVIEPDDQGFAWLDADPRIDPLYTHRDCLLRAVLPEGWLSA